MVLALLSQGHEHVFFPCLSLFRILDTAPLPLFMSLCDPGSCWIQTHIGQQLPFFCRTVKETENSGSPASTGHLYHWDKHGLGSLD